MNTNTLAGKGTAPKTKEELMAALKASHEQMSAEIDRTSDARAKSALKAAVDLVNVNHWFTLDLPEINTLCASFPGLLPCPNHTGEQVRIMLGIAWSTRHDSEDMLTIYADRLDEQYPEKKDRNAPLRSMSEWIDALAHNALLFKVKPYNIDELLDLAAQSFPEINLPLYRERFHYYTKKKQQAAEKKDDPKEKILSLMEPGKLYPSSFFIPDHITTRSEFRRVMGALVDAKRVEQSGERNSTRYTRTDGVMRSVKTPPPSDVFK